MRKIYIICFVLVIIVFSYILFASRVTLDIEDIKHMEIEIHRSELEHYGVSKNIDSISDIERMSVRCTIKNKSFLNLFDVWLYFDDVQKLPSVIYGNELDTLYVAPYKVGPYDECKIDFSFLVDGKKFNSTEELLNKLKEVKIYVGLRKNDRKISESENLDITQWDD